MCTVSVFFTTTDLAMCSNKKSKDPKFNINALGFLHAIPHYFFPTQAVLKF
jgi:hypothetical protein